MILERFRGGVKTGHFVQQAGDAAHFEHLLHLLAEILQIEALTLLNFLRQFERFFLVDFLLHLLDQAQHVALAENPGRHPFGMKWLQRGGFFAHAEKLDRFAGDLADRQSRAAPGVAVGLGQHHPGQRQGVIERLGGGGRILAGHAVDHKQGFNRIERRVQALDFCHHVLIDVQAAGGIDDQHLHGMQPGVLQRLAGDGFRRLIGLAGIKFRADLAS